MKKKVVKTAMKADVHFYSGVLGLFGVVLPDGTAATMKEGKSPAEFHHLKEVPEDSVPMHASDEAIDYVEILNTHRADVAEMNCIALQGRTT